MGSQRDNNADLDAQHWRPPANFFFSGAAMRRFIRQPAQSLRDRRGEPAPWQHQDFRALSTAGGRTSPLALQADATRGTRPNRGFAPTREGRDHTSSSSGSRLVAAKSGSAASMGRNPMRLCQKHRHADSFRSWHIGREAAHEERSGWHGARAISALRDKARPRFVEADTLAVTTAAKRIPVWPTAQRPASSNSW